MSSILLLMFPHSPHPPPRQRRYRTSRRSQNKTRTRWDLTSMCLRRATQPLLSALIENYFLFPSLALTRIRCAARSGTAGSFPLPGREPGRADAGAPRGCMCRHGGEGSGLRDAGMDVSGLPGVGRTCPGMEGGGGSGRGRWGDDVRDWRFSV